jgi:colanic acid/amylovoran biosynthesis glycosyltransferase
MRVLIFSEYFGSVTKTFIYNEVLSLTPHAEVHLLTNWRGDAEPVPFPNVTVIPWNRNKIVERFMFECWKRDWWFSHKYHRFRKAINRIVDEFKPDVIHCHFANESIRFTDNFYHDNIPVIITMHGYDATMFNHMKSYRRKIQSTFSRPNIFPMFVSEHIRRKAAALGVPVDKGYLLYLGINLDRFIRQTYPSRKDGLLFTQVSSFASQKGHQYTIRAIRKFIDSKPPVPVRFVFGGAGEKELQETKKMVSDYGLENHIHFTGSLTPDQVKDLLESTHIFIHHSVTGPSGETEGLPVSIMEAMAMELPVLSTWHAGIPELVQDGVNGILVKEKDIDAYVNAMHQMIRWDYLPNNRQRVLEMCEMKNHAVQLIEVYYDVISRTKSKSDSEISSGK